MLCPHLLPLEQHLASLGVATTYRGQPWSRNCREWIYVAAHLDLPSLRAKLNLDPCIVDHTNDDPRSGQEKGFVCSEHHDGIVGAYEASATNPTIS